MKAAWRQNNKMMSGMSNNDHIIVAEVSENSNEEEKFSKISSDGENEWVHLDDRNFSVYNNEDRRNKGRYQRNTNVNGWGRSNDKDTIDESFQNNGAKCYQDLLFDSSIPNKTQNLLFSKSSNKSSAKNSRRQNEEDEEGENSDEDMMMISKKKANRTKMSFDDLPLEIIPINATPKDHYDSSKINDNNQKPSKEQIHGCSNTNQTEWFRDHLQMDFDERLFRKETSSDEDLDEIQLRELEEKTGRSRASTPDWQPDFTPRHVFFIDRNNEIG